MSSLVRGVPARLLHVIGRRARALGRPRSRRLALRIFWRVFLPMTASGVVGAALIAFVFTLGFFVTPAILGGGRSIMAAELVYRACSKAPTGGLARRSASRWSCWSASSWPPCSAWPGPRSSAARDDPAPGPDRASARWLGRPSCSRRCLRSCRSIHARALPHNAERPPVAHPLPRADRRPDWARSIS